MEPVTVKILPDEPAEIIGRQLIAVGVAIGATAVLVYVQRKMSGPDFFVNLRMRALYVTGQYADARIRFWRNVADKASRMYLESRP
jgi:hypothetical protein